jgi:hypothetical protein
MSEKAAIPVLTGSFARQLRIGAPPRVAGFSLGTQPDDSPPTHAGAPGNAAILAATAQRPAAYRILLAQVHRREEIEYCV